MESILLLVRHAKADFPVDRLAGWTPSVGLSEEGREQARRLAERLAPVRLAAIYSSPLDRCRQTAAAIAEGRKLEVRIAEGVAEVRFGTWQGRPLRALAKTALWRKVQHAPSQAAFPGGESIRVLQQRAVEAVEEIRTETRKGVVAVVSHADTIKAVAAHYLGMHLDLYQRIVIAPASVTAIGFGGGMPRTLKLSDTGSYEDLVPPRRSPAKRKGGRG